MSLATLVSALATRIGQVVKPLLFIPAAPVANDAFRLLRSAGVFSWEVDNRPDYLFLAAPVTNSTVTLASTLMSVPVVAGTYWFKVHAICSTVAAPTGTRVVLNGPAFSKLRYTTTRSNGAAATQVASGQNAWLLPAAAATNSGTSGSETFIEGIVVLTAAGNLVVQFASEVAASLVTLEPGSHITWRKVA